MDEDKSVVYCYDCGRRISKKQDHCLYCSAPIRPWVRPPKHCTFCGEPVRHEAVKCRHCGEFLDGRSRAPQGGVVNHFYVIEKALLNAAHDYRLMAGKTVPSDIAHKLDPATVRAIESNRPELLQQPGVYALPAPRAQAPARDPDDDEIVDAEDAFTSDAPRLDRPALPMAGGGEAGGANLPVRSDLGATLPARHEDSPPPPPALMHAGLALGRALGGVGRWLVKSGGKPKEDASIDVRVEDRYRICERCQAEILATDNFCFHCGVQYHRTVADENRERRERLSYRGLVRNLFIHLTAMVLLLFYAGARIAKIPPLAQFESGLGLAAAGFCLAGVFLCGGGFSKFLSVLLGLGLVSVYLFF